MRAVEEEEDEDVELSSVYGRRIWEPSAKVGEPLKTQLFLRNNENGGMDELVYRHGLRMRRHRKYPIVLLKYQQLSAPFHLAITRECRGLVLEENTWRVLSYPYEKFFNMDEPMSKKGPQLDWSTVRCYEKLDGSLATLYCYNGEWMVSSSGTPDGDGALGTEEDTSTFAEIFWDIWKHMQYRYPDNRNMCYIFEMITRKNPIVVVPSEDVLILHGARDLTTFAEVWPEPIAEKYGWQCVKSYPMQSFQEVEKACRALNPHEHEGFVLVDANFNRRKVKSPAYVGLSLMSTRDSVEGNERNMLRIVRQNETDEFLAYYPQWEQMCWYVRKRLNALIATLLKRITSGSTSKEASWCEETEKAIKSITTTLNAKKTDAKTMDLLLREWYCGLDISIASIMLDEVVPVDTNARAKMMIAQKAKFEELGISVKAKKKKKNKKRNNGGTSWSALQEESPKPTSNNNNNNNNEDDTYNKPAAKSKKEQRKEAKWTVVISGSGRRKGKGKETFDDLDRMISEMQRRDNDKQKKNGKKKK